MKTGTLKFKYSRNRIFYLIIAGCFILMPSLVKAQMFSVKGSHQPSKVTPRYHIYAGVGPAHFRYWPKSGNDIYSFDGEVAHLVLEAYNFKLFFSKGIGLGHISYFETGIQGGYELQIYRSQKVHLQVPLQLQAGITTVTNDEQVLGPNTSSFREGTISIRTGADFNVRVSPHFRVGAGIIPHFGLTYSAGRYNGGGNVLGLTGTLRLFFDHLFGNAGLSLGYSYDFRKFNVKDNRFDYNAVENGFLIGVTF